MFLFPQSICHDINQSDVYANSLFHCLFNNLSLQEVITGLYKDNWCCVGLKQIVLFSWSEQCHDDFFYCETDAASDKCFTVVLPINAWNTNTAHMLLLSYVFCASQSLSALLDLLWHLHIIQLSVTDSHDTYFFKRDWLLVHRRSRVSLSQRKWCKV